MTLWENAMSGTGPSPQAWGTPVRRPVLSRVFRAIPTGVGNSVAGRAAAAPEPGHPHRRGELYAPRAVLELADGPSPQAWGTPLEQAGEALTVRAIPTGVGNSRHAPDHPARPAGHPDRRGELPGGPSRRRSRSGPSPQAWGTRLDLISTNSVERAIPTGVGNSTPGRPLTPTLTGHPHRRGELKLRLLMPGSSTGPSPQAWGTRAARPRVRAAGRAIPTGVGNSSCQSPTRTCTAGHPHRRGEIMSLLRPRPNDGGPSPQAWGTPQLAPPRGPHGRAIPTGVGNSRHVSSSPP